MPVPNSQGESILGVFRVIYRKIKTSGEIQGVVILGVENGGASLKGLPGYGDCGHTATYNAVSLKDCDSIDHLGLYGGGGVAAEEVGDRGAADAAT